MRLPFFRASKPAVEPTQPVRGKAGPASTGTGKDALGMPGEGPLQAARTAARRRLMGAAVLLAMGVIGFPIFFETKPRPLPVDLPILLPDGVGRKVAAGASAPALPKPPPDAGVESGPTATSALAPAPSPAVTQPPSVPTLAAAPPSPVSASSPAKPAVGASAPARVATAADKPAAPASKSVPVPAAAKPQPAASDAAPAAGGRFVVQVGAYNDPERLRAARQKLEKMGLKSYTQEVDTATGKRIRVRVGPFPTRKEADTVAAKVKASGMQANILAL